jgi:hypothetical protein
VNQRLGSGLALLGAAAFLVFALEPRGPLAFYWLPLAAGAGFLTAAAASGRPGQMWEAGFVLTGWGILAALVLSGTVDVDPEVGYLVGVGVGVLAACVAARRFRLRVTLPGLSLAVLYVVLSYLWGLYGPETLRTDPAVFAVLIAVRGLVELRQSTRGSRAV